MRFERQISMPSIGIEGQKKLASAHVLVVGAGGLGCPVLAYLAAAGVGTISIIDHDTVSISNLNRQILYSVDDIGQSKAKICAAKLQAQYKDVEIIAKYEELTSDNILGIASQANVIVNCVDLIATRLMINDFAMNKGIALVEGGIDGFYGFCFGTDGGACLRCTGLDASKDKKNWPAIGTTAGIIGSLQANICIKIILGQSSSVCGRIIHFDGNTLEFDSIIVNQSPNCTLHKA